MDIQLINGKDAFSRLEGEWDRLAGRSMTDTPFQSLAYQRSWWQHLGPGDLHTITIRDEQGLLMAIACFYLLDGVLYFNGCTEETDYLDLIAPFNTAAAAWHCVFEALEHHDFPPWQALELCNIPAASATHEILPQLSRERGYSFATQVQDVCPVIALPASFDDYLMRLDKKQRHEIRRKRRRAVAAGAQITSVESTTDLASEVDDFLDLLQMSTTEKEGWLNEGRRNVFHEVAAAAMEAGTLQLVFLEAKGKKAAGLYNFDYKGRIWVYNSGLDIIEFGYLSPGVVLTAAAIESAIDRDRNTFDFLRGDETYKYRFGAEDTTVHRIEIKREG